MDNAGKRPQRTENPPSYLSEAAQYCFCLRLPYSTSHDHHLAACLGGLPRPTKPQHQGKAIQTDPTLQVHQSLVTSRDNKQIFKNETLVQLCTSLLKSVLGGRLCQLTGWMSWSDLCCAGAQEGNDAWPSVQHCWIPRTTSFGHSQPPPGCLSQEWEQLQGLPEGVSPRIGLGSQFLPSGWA